MRKIQFTKSTALSAIFFTLNECKSVLKDRVRKADVFCLLTLILAGIYSAWVSDVQAATSLRRPLSPLSPMYLVHIDSWASPNPQQCIDLIPSDIRPYVVINLSISLSTTDNGYSVADTWLNTCAQNGMWAMVQPSSGIRNIMSDTSIVQYERLYKRYSNLIGFNFCEQTWGYNSTTFLQRLDLFTRLLKLSNSYGGYLYVNDCFSISNAGFNGVAKFKKSAAFADATKTYKDNYIVGDKFTNSIGYYDNESANLGVYLSGHAGHYAVRYDQYSWGWSGRGRVFGAETTARHEGTLSEFGCPEAVMGVPIINHMMLTGASVIDGPEIPWMSVMFRDKLAPCFKNMVGDIFRKVLDGTIKIPTLSEVISRTKIAFVNDVDYNTTDSLYTGLYAMDGTLSTNRTWFKKSGRYPTIPELYSSAAYETSGFATTVKKSAYSTRWPNNAAKVAEFKSMFPSEYTGNMSVSRVDNRWFAYNPWINTDTIAKASIPLKYNTCDSVNLSYPAHTFSIMNETANQIQIYLNNYRTDKDSLWNAYPNDDLSWYRMQNYIMPAFMANPWDKTLRTSVIKVYGSTSLPTYTLIERGSHRASSASYTWSGGVFTLSVTHNGPVDISINSSGNATTRLTAPANNTLTVPGVPSAFGGDRVYEAEYATLSTASATSNFSGYSGMGWVDNFSNSSSSSVKFTVNVPTAGAYKLKTQYSAPSGAISTVDLYVNGIKVATPTFPATATDSTWLTHIQSITLNAGVNNIQFKATVTGANINFDNIIITNKQVSTISVTGDHIYSFDGAVHGPNAVSVTGSTGAVTISYTGTGLTNYASSIICPTAIGTYKAVATVDEDDSYSGAVSVAFPFSIVEGNSIGYDFESFAANSLLTGTTDPAIAAYGTTPNSGTASVVSYTGTDNGVSNTSLVFKPTAQGSGTNKVGVANLSLFPTATDYSVTWKEYYATGTKGGVLLRASGTAIGDNPGLLSGYYFQTTNTAPQIRKIDVASGTTTFSYLGTATTITAPGAGVCRWYRATVQGNVLSFEYSNDGVIFYTIQTYTDVSNTYTAGTTQFIWGLNTSYAGTVYYDDIIFRSLSTSTSVSEPRLDTDAIQLYPNPVKEQLNMSLTFTPVDNVQIFNSMGCLVKSVVAVEGTNIVNMSDQLPGLYLVKVPTSSGIITRKVIK